MHKIHIVFILIFIFCIHFLDVYGQVAIQFVENKGQWDASVTYRGRMNIGLFYLQKDGYTVRLDNASDREKLINCFHSTQAVSVSHIDETIHQKPSPISFVFRWHAYKVKYLNANLHTEVQSSQLQSYMENYLVGSKSNWRSGCHSYQSVTYKNVYPHIDIHYYTGTDGNLKYEWILYPGADISDIKMQWEGADGLNLSQKGDLIVHTSVEDVVESKPFCYQPVEGGRKVLPGFFLVDSHNNIVTFHVDDSYNKDNILVIDPTLIFSTYAGSKANNFGYTATYDANGNAYGGGTVFDEGFPTSTGAFQQNYTPSKAAPLGIPSFNVGIIKFSPDGTNRIYATYLGGSGGADQPSSMEVMPNGNLVILGRTNSSDFPTTLPNYGPCGSFVPHIFVTILNATGTALVDSRLFGGTGSDGINERFDFFSNGLTRNYGDDAKSEVSLDANNNIYVASCSQSSDFPTSANAFQKVNKSASTMYPQNGIVMKLDPTLNVLFSTYLGGSGEDACYNIALNPTNNNIYVSGATSSKDIPGNRTGTVGPNFFSPSSGVNGFIAILSNDGSTINNASYIGVNDGWAVNYGLQFDGVGYPYICGVTNGSFPVVNAAYSEAGGKQFIEKLQPDLSAVVYSTVFGPNTSNPNLSITALLVDYCENVYVAGWGGLVSSESGFPNGGTAGLSITSDAIQSATNGNNFYFFVLKKDASSQLYGTYFGQSDKYGTDHVDGGTSRFDPSGIIYEAICANCLNQGVFPTTPSAWSSNKSGGQGCNLAVVKIDIGFSGVRAAISATINGSSNVTSGCAPYVANFTDPKGGADTYTWDFGDGSPLLVTTTPSTSHTYTKVGQYKVGLFVYSATACKKYDTAYLLLSATDGNVKLNFTSSSLVPCSSLTYQFQNTSISSVPFLPGDFSWNFGDGTTVTAGSETVEHTYLSTGTYIVTLTLATNRFCNATGTIQQSITVALGFPPVSSFTYSPNPPQLNQPFLFTNESSSDAVNFSWNFGDGTPLLNTTNRGVITHDFLQSGDYNVCLTAFNSSGCSAQYCISTSPSVKPVIDVANAFTPTNDVNQKIFVRGAGIASMLWRIYDRWGRIVFTAINQSQGWDGRYNGVLEPLDVYTYTLDVVLSNGIKVKKTGDITLLK